MTVIEQAIVEIVESIKTLSNINSTNTKSVEGISRILVEIVNENTALRGELADIKEEVIIIKNKLNN